MTHDQEDGGPACADLVIGATVEHTSFGRGVVHGLDEDRVTILFEEAGYRILCGTSALADGVLTRAT